MTCHKGRGYNEDLLNSTPTLISLSMVSAPYEIASMNPSKGRSVLRGTAEVWFSASPTSSSLSLSADSYGESRASRFMAFARFMLFAWFNAGSKRIRHQSKHAF